jgi:hypothetical protein
MSPLLHFYLLLWKGVYCSVASSGSTVLAFNCHVTLLPPSGCSSWVAYKHITISSLRRCAYDICDCLCEWHVRVMRSRGFCFQSSWVSHCCPPPAPSLELIILSAMVLLQMFLPCCASATCGLQSLQTPSLRDGLVFFPQLDAHHWNPSLRGYPMPPVVLPTAPLWLLSHWAVVTLLLPSIQGEEHGCTPGHCSGTSSLPSRSMWCLKSMDASWACMTLSPRMNSSVILATEHPSC